MICFYHSDNDGKCAGYWVDKCGLLDEHGKTFFKIDYGIDFPFDKIHKDERVYIVDYSIPPEQMDKLLEITPNVVWIDHHKSAIEMYKDYDKETPFSSLYVNTFFSPCQQKRSGAPIFYLLFFS